MMAGGNAERVVIVGGGGFGQEIAAWAADCAKHGGMPGIAGYIDDHAREPIANTISWLGTVADYAPQPGDALIIAVGSPQTKKQLVEMMRERGAHFARLIHPTAIVGPNCSHGEGVIMCPFTMNTASTAMGDFSTLLSFSGLGHDAQLGRYSTVSSHVDLMGHAKVGTMVFIGSGARVMPGISVADNCRIGANVVVQRHTKPGVTLFSAPAKSLRMPEKS